MADDDDTPEPGENGRGPAAGGRGPDDPGGSEGKAAPDDADGTDRDGSAAVDDLDLGTPISELFALELPTGDEFLRGVRRRIDRREMAASAVDFSFVHTGNILWSYLELLLDSVLGSRSGARPGRDS